MLVVLSKTKQLIVLDPQRKFRAVTNKASYLHMRGAKDTRKKEQFL